MDRFEELEAYVAVIDYQGFGKAGERLGIAKSMVSRRVSQLETRLGVQLLQRTTRRQSMTDAGREFYRRATQLLADLNEAEQFVSDSHSRLSGRIRLAMPLGFGIRQLAEPISRFLAEHPGIDMDIDLNDRQVDLIEENIDLAIRLGDLEDSTLIARKLASVQLVTCASPDYLERRGEPVHPAELNRHEVVIYSNAPVSWQWSYREDGKAVNTRVKYRISVNSGEFLALLASRGLALVSAPLPLLQDYIDSGALVPVLEDFEQPIIGVYAVYPPGRLVSRRARVLSDTIYEYFRERDF
ncbi:MAG: LysR family transcriptional regulator [Gammaproteobacteria bacterium]|jgi:DNA-binding transcriptional LysR family regulator